MPFIARSGPISCSQTVARMAGSTLLFAVTCMAQSGNCVIQSSAVGTVRVGMTVRQARQVLGGAKVTQAEDSDRISILVVTRDGKRAMDLYPDNDNPAKEQAVIELVRVYDPACATADGVHAGMLLSEVAQHFGRMKRLVKMESEPREYADFEKVPNWLEIQPGQGEAGIYPKGSRCTTQFHPDARVASLWVSKPLTNKLPEDPGFCETAIAQRR